MTALAQDGEAQEASRVRRLAGLGLLAGLAALTCLHVWINLVHVPWERPMAALFDSGPTIREGWAPWYAPPLFGAILTLALLTLYFWRARRWTLPAIAIAGLFAVVFGAWAAYWVKNIGYTWYFIPGTNVIDILSIQPQMAALAFGRAAQLLSQNPVLLATGVVAGLVVALVLRAPLRAVKSVRTGSSVIPGQAGPPGVVQAGWLARVATAALMAALGGSLASLGVAAIGFVVAPIAGLIWFFVSFRDGRYCFTNVLIGSATIAALAGLPLALFTMQPSFGPGFGNAGRGSSIGFDLQFFLFGVAVRCLVLVLLSVAAIKIPLLLSRTFANVRDKVLASA
ncbi:MAG: hypothetical protein ACJ8F3_00240 [Xanthobacteraceae bacterium]